MWYPIKTPARSGSRYSAVLAVGLLLLCGGGLFAQTVEIADLQLQQEDGSASLQLVADGPLVWTQYRDASSNLVVELPNTRVSENVASLTPAEGLVSAVLVEIEENGQRPLTRLVIQTRGEAEHTLTVEDRSLHLELAQQGTPLPNEPAVAELEAPSSELPEEIVGGSEIVEEPLAPDTFADAEAPEPISAEDLSPEKEPATYAQARPAAREPMAVSPATLGTVDEPYQAPPPLGVVASRLEGVVEDTVGGEAILRVLGDGEFDYSTFLLQNPPRFVVDLDGVVNTALQSVVEVESASVAQVRLAQFEPQPDPVSRVVFDMNDPAMLPVVERSGDGLTVRFLSSSDARSAAASTPVESAPIADTSRSARDDAAELQPDEPTSPLAVEATAPGFEPELSELEVSDEVTLPVFEEADAPELQVAAASPLDEPLELQAPPSEAPTPIDDIDNVRSYEAQSVEIDSPQTTRDTDSDDPFGVRTIGQEQQYYGEPISMSLKDADVTEVLRSIARLSNLNIVIQPGVGGPVTVELDRVPWDQALEQILKINNLGMQLEGNILRIAPIEQLRREAQEQQQLEYARALSVPLRTVMRRINYSRAREVATILTQGQRNVGGAGIGSAIDALSNPGGILSPRGSISVDDRTNTLIIQELPDYLDTVIQVIENIDIPERQVMIEARIVETSRQFSQTLGIQWGLQGESSAELGNTTGLVFPNNGEVDAGVQLLTGGANGFIDLALGNILNTFQLDIAIQAAESDGLVNVISAPKIATLNNSQASIQSGLQIPIQTVANNTVSVQFVNATLRLDVTPQVTAEGTILMDINIQKREPQLAFAVVGATNAPISTREARTRVLVRDGGTAVIGGIYQVSTNDGTDKVPGLANVPIIGHLFKNRSRSNQNEELLIFITPRVIQL